MADAVSLGYESQQVIALRLMRLAEGGPAAHAEAERMVTEKIAALLQTGVAVSRGDSGKKIMRRYRAHVRANRRRLLAR